MDKFCHSCSAPLNMSDFRGPAEDYCKYCTDESGNLKSRQEIRQGIAQWFKGWQPNLDEQTAIIRAELFMKAMPAWADE
ncbi:MAG: hypothetical protein JSV44_06695 [Candidatus Zixiibacteriota bacterium]|nr:MAG: hypothetical protein JSV44_06695 [candidate division Zixibacteria bacterium]